MQYKWHTICVLEGLDVRSNCQLPEETGDGSLSLKGLRMSEVLHDSGSLLLGHANYDKIRQVGKLKGHSPIFFRTKLAATNIGRGGVFPHSLRRNSC